MAEWNLLTTKAHPSGKMEPFFWVTRNLESTHAFKQLSLSQHSPPRHRQAFDLLDGIHHRPSAHLICEPAPHWQEPKAFENGGETFQDVRHSADAAAFLRRNRSPAWGMGSTRQRASRSTPRPCRECPPPVLLLIESASASGSVHPPPNPVIPLTRGK